MTRSGKCLGSGRQCHSYKDDVNIFSLYTNFTTKEDWRSRRINSDRSQWTRRTWSVIMGIVMGARVQRTSIHPSVSNHKTTSSLSSSCRGKEGLIKCPVGYSFPKTVVPCPTQTQTPNLTDDDTEWWSFRPSRWTLKMVINVIARLHCF